MGGWIHGSNKSENQKEKTICYFIISFTDCPPPPATSQIQSS
jgi:hypothetical protein